MLVILDLVAAFCLVMLGEQYEQATINHQEISFWYQSFVTIAALQAIRHGFQGSLVGFVLFLVLVPLTRAQYRYHYIRYRAERKGERS